MYMYTALYREDMHGLTLPLMAKTTLFVILLCLLPDEFPLSNTRRFSLSRESLQERKV